jgi:hypothetical protein
MKVVSMFFLAAILFLLAAGAVLAGDSRTATTAEREACEAPLVRQLESIESQLRRGYDGSEGERLKSRRRELQARRLGCRKFPPDPR